VDELGPGVPEPRVLLSGLAFPESPRWHEGRLWVSDWGAHEVVAVALDGASEVVARVASFPMCIDFLPDGRLLIVSARDGRLLRLEPDGSLVTHADLSHLADHKWNDIVVDGRGNAYVNNTGFDFPGGEFAPGIVALVTPDGSARQVADGVAFPNGMVVTPDDSTLVVAESYAGRLTAFDVASDGGLSNRRMWADLDGGAPDGICLDADGAIWHADVPNKRCVRVREGGEVLQAIELDRGCFACMLGGEDRRTLFLVANEWAGPASMESGPRMGQVLTAPASAPASAGPGPRRARPPAPRPLRTRPRGRATRGPRSARRRARPRRRAS
jgi:sugar lactone lactonase YvrE